MAKSFTLKELAALVGGQISGSGDIVITGLNGMEHAADGEITFVTSSSKSQELAASRASAAIVPQTGIDTDLPCIRVENPELAATVVHTHFLRREFVAEGIHSSAHIGRECSISDQVSICPLVTVGDRVRIGDRVTLYPGVVIGDDCSIGDDTVLHANVCIAERTVIGNRVIIHAGTAIGSDGFGYATDQNGRHMKKPQVGNVRIDDDVEIGANSCVDRAAFGTTRIRQGVKIDNLVMVAHNVDVGENSILVAQAGVAGSTTLGNNVVLGAKAGVAGHLKLDDRVMVAAMGGVHSDLAKDSVVAGYPAFDIARWRRATASFARLPEMLKELRSLRKQVDQLVDQLQQGKTGAE